MKPAPHATRTLVIAVALVSAGFFAAYLRFLPYLEREAEYTDGRRHYALDEIEQLRFAMWDEPAGLGVAVNGPDDEGRGVVSPDGRSLVFAVGDEGLNADLYVADLVDGRAVDPRPLARVNTTADDVAPAFAADALWFASNRPGGEGGFDLYRAPYADGVFGFVERVAAGLNGPHDELDPAPLPGSSAVAFASDRRRAMGLDLFLAAPAGAGLTPDDTLLEGTLAPDAEVASADGAWAVSPIDALNTPFHDRDPGFTNDGRTLLFASNRSGGSGGFDLYTSVQSAGTWQPPVPLDTLNGAADERSPSPSRDGFTLLYTSSDGLDGSRDLLRARSRELHRLPGRPVGWFDLTLLALLLLLALLAWLGKHWEALDVLYKCLLVSLLIHLALAYWFRDVYVESEPVEVPPPRPSFRVQLAPSAEALAARRERSGDVDGAAERAAPEVAAPSRAESVELAQLAGERDAARPAETGGLEAPRLASASAPDAAPAGAATPERSSSSADVAAPTGETATRVADSAPMVVTATRVTSGDDAASARGTVSPSARPARASEAPAGTSVAAAAPTPRTGSLEMPTLSTDDAPASTGGVAAGGRAGDAPAPRRAQRASVPALAALEGGGPTRSAPEAAPTLSLDGLSGASSEARPSRASASGRPDAPSRLSSPGLGPSSLPRSAAPRPTPGGRVASSGVSGRDAPLPAASTAAAAAPSRDDTVGDVAVATPEGDVHQGAARPSVSSAVAAAPSRRDAVGDIAPATPGADAPSGAANTSAPSEGRATLDIAALDLGTSQHSPSSRRSPSARRRPARIGAPSSLDVLAPPAPAPSYTPLSMPVAAADARPRAPVTAPGDAFAETPYRTRFGDEKLRALEEHGGSDETEEAVRLGLAYLADIQQSDGHWGSASDYDDKYGRVTVGKTGLCLLAFLGAGHTPESGTEHSDVTARAVELLLRVQDDDTGHFGYSEAYSHGIATYALAECYALTKAEELRAPLERAVAQIVRNQNRTSDRRRNGGWSYYYPDGRTFDRWPRTSITAWQVMALESARLGGLDVADHVFDAAGGFLRSAHRAPEGVVVYSQDPARLNSAYWTLPGSTPAGLFALSLLGEDLADARWASALGFVRRRAPDGYRLRSQDAFVEEASGNLYFWYYGTLTMFRRGGDDWDAWNTALQDTLLPSQDDDGSWRPISVYAEYARDTDRDRAYTTALNVLTLEVYYRYFTPLLEVR